MTQVGLPGTAGFLGILLSSLWGSVMGGGVCVRVRVCVCARVRLHAVY